MIRLRTFILLGTMLFVPLFAFSQDPVGSWQEHLPYRKGIAVDEGETKYYCATREAIFTYNKSNQSIERLTKVNALSDIGISAMKYNHASKILVVGYENGNIDLISSNTSYNLPAILNSDILGSKKINNIYNRGNEAYLSCGFGIVVLDLEKRNVKDTYLIGENSAEVPVNQVTFYNDSIWALTDEGVYMAPISASNLADFNQWEKNLNVPDTTAAYDDIVVQGDRLILQNLVSGRDSLYYRDNNNWFTHPYSDRKMRDIDVSQDTMLTICLDFSSLILDQNDQKVHHIYTYNDEEFVYPNGTVYTSNGNFLIADGFQGMTLGKSPWEAKLISPEGPYTNAVHNIDIKDDHLWIATGSVGGSKWENNWRRDGIYHYHEAEWEKIYREEFPMLDSIYDIINIAIDPSDPEHVFAGSWGSGLIEIQDGELVNHHDHNSGSSLQDWWQWEGFCGIGGITFDEDGNLWVTNSYTDNPVSVLKPDGSWQSYTFKPTLDENTFMGPIITTDENQKWIVLPRGTGLFVWDDNGTINNPSDDKYKKLSKKAGKGNLPSNNIHTVVEDLDGEIWVGTEEGVAVFYTPTDIFSNSPSDAQQIYFEQDGLIEVLLETEVVTTIAIDGGDRKWIGTQSGGVFLMSSDGTEIIKNFNEDNSPLLSNSIKDIEVNHETGQIYIGTGEGVIAYQGEATKGKQVLDTLHIYPNPVTTDYHGPISITGLPRDSDVKITDISGDVVYRTRSLGGKALWNGKDFSGVRVKSGVYYIFCSSPEGEQNKVGKILFMN